MQNVAAEYIQKQKNKQTLKGYQVLLGFYKQKNIFKYVLEKQLTFFPCSNDIRSEILMMRLFVFLNYNYIFSYLMIFVVVCLEFQEFPCSKILVNQITKYI